MTAYHSGPWGAGGCAGPLCGGRGEGECPGGKCASRGLCLGPLPGALVTLAFDARPPNVRFAARPCCSGLAVRTAARDEHGPIVGAATYPSPPPPALGTHTPPTASPRTPEPRSMTSGGLAWWPGGPASRLCACVPGISPGGGGADPRGHRTQQPRRPRTKAGQAVALALGGLKPDRWQERPRASPKPGSPGCAAVSSSHPEPHAPAEALPGREAGLPGSGPSRLLPRPVLSGVPPPRPPPPTAPWRLLWPKHHFVEFRLMSQA